MNGYESHTNELGFQAIRIHYSSDPEKDRAHPDPEVAKRASEWYDRARRMYPDPLQWQQEMEISWWVAAGLRVYPEFNETLHCLPLDGYRERKVIYRAWDFGWHAPACLIAQIDSKDRLIVLKEIVGNQELTKEFAQKVIKKCAEWFGAHSAGYQDFCDPAGQKVNSGANERSETRDVEILGSLGIHPTWEYGWSRKDGRSLVHQLLLPRTDNTPSMYVSNVDCPILVQGFLGKYVYPQDKSGTAHDEPKEDNHPWADVHAALRYLVTGLYTALGLRRPTHKPTPAREVTFHGYGTPKRGR